jgi:hypothetical protein
MLHTITQVLQLTGTSSRAELDPLLLGFADEWLPDIDASLSSASPPSTPFNAMGQEISEPASSSSSVAASSNLLFEAPSLAAPGQCSGVTENVQSSMLDETTPELSCASLSSSILPITQNVTPGSLSAVSMETSKTSGIDDLMSVPLFSAGKSESAASEPVSVSVIPMSEVAQVSASGTSSTIAELEPQSPSAAFETETTLNVKSLRDESDSSSSDSSPPSQASSSDSSSSDSSPPSQASSSDSSSSSSDIDESAGARVIANSSTEEPPVNRWKVVYSGGIGVRQVIVLFFFFFFFFFNFL